MNKTSIGIVVGVLLLMAVGIVAFVSQSNYQGEVVTINYTEPVALEAGGNAAEKVNDSVVFDFEVDKSEVMLTFMSNTEFDKLHQELEQLFMSTFVDYVNLDVDAESFYNQKHAEIEKETGLVSYNQFQQLQNKLMAIPTYEKCLLIIDETSFTDDGDNCHLDIEAVFDDVMSTEFYLSISKGDLTYRIY